MGLAKIDPLTKHVCCIHNRVTNYDRQEHEKSNRFTKPVAP